MLLLTIKLPYVNIRSKLSLIRTKHHVFFPKHSLLLFTTQRKEYFLIFQIASIPIDAINYIWYLRAYDLCALVSWTEDALSYFTGV